MSKKIVIKAVRVYEFPFEDVEGDTVLIRLENAKLRAKAEIEDMIQGDAEDLFSFEAEVENYLTPHKRMIDRVIKDMYDGEQPLDGDEVTELSQYFVKRLCSSQGEEDQISEILK